MLYSNKQLVHPGVRARDLPALMELYELNYIQLRQLLTDVELLQDHDVSRVKNALDLHLTIRERSKYTTTLMLTYDFSRADGQSLAPDLLIRLYHDAQSAEVLSRGSRKGRHNRDYDRLHNNNYPVQVRWQVNRFLHKWLAYCLRQGHGFSPGRKQYSEVLDAIECDGVLSLES